MTVSKVPLPADLPEDWGNGDIVSPLGTDVGLSEQHGYNYQSKQINDTQLAVNEVAEEVEKIKDDMSAFFIGEEEPEEKRGIWFDTNN